MRGTVAAVVAHPDDESLIAGGTLALAARAGLRTGVVSLTRGEQGPIADPALASVEQLGEVRQEELHRAARALGLDWSVCLAFPDGELEWINHEAAAAELAAALSPWAPDVVLTFGDDGLYWHRDHIAAGEIAALAVQRLDTPADIYAAAWPNGLMTELTAAAAQRGLPYDLWGLEPAAFGGDRRADVTLDVRAVLPRKLAALRAHRTQLASDHLFTSLPLDLAERFLGAEFWAGPHRERLQELLGGG
ncbi:MAG TPA: PIG-L deacetylase family protein [Solirubrobacteraceae bacterium]